MNDPKQTKSQKEKAFRELGRHMKYPITYTIELRKKPDGTKTITVKKNNDANQ